MDAPRSHGEDEVMDALVVALHKAMYPRRTSTQWVMLEAGAETRRGQAWAWPPTADNFVLNFF